MGHNVISHEELETLIKNGAMVTPEKEIVEIPGLSDLVSKLSDMINNNEFLAKKQQDQTREILSSVLSQLTTRQSIDVTPIANAIANIRPQIQVIPCPGFTFNITRNARNLMTSVDVVPKVAR